MLHSFLTANRNLLIERCRALAAARMQSDRGESKISHGMPLFLDQLIETLIIEQNPDSARSRSLSGVSGGGTPSEIADAATLRSRELLKSGFALEQVVREYGDVCQAVTNLAFETHAPIAVEEFRTLNRCLDNAIAGAVTEFSSQQTASAAEDAFNALNSRLGPLAHELRNYLHAAMHAVKAIKAGKVGIAGATGAVLDRSLLGMRNLIDSSLAEVRVIAGLPPRAQAIRLADFLGEVEAGAALDPRAAGIKLTVTPVDLDIEVYADPEMLASAIGNLLQNAFKFTKRHTEVTLHACRDGDRILVEIKDQCGGLPPGPAETLLRPFAQGGSDRSGLGLGLEICRRSVEANQGLLTVRDLPGIGCVFTIALPRHAQATLDQNAEATSVVR
jgi:signal transduction histidine kinase